MAKHHGEAIATTAEGESLPHRFPLPDPTFRYHRGNIMVLSYFPQKDMLYFPLPPWMLSHPRRIIFAPDD